MPRSYRNIKMYENEIVEMKSKGITNSEIGEKFGITIKQVKNLLYRCKENQRKIAAGIAIQKKGRPTKDCIITDADKIGELKYILARKDAKIKQLEMENELMRDFLSLTERK